MESYKRIIEIVNTNLINCLIPIILTLIVIELIFKNRFETKKVLALISWVIIFHAVIMWAFYLIEIITTENPFINRIAGPYILAFWTMFLSTFMLPLTLFIRKLASKFWYVLLVVFVMNSGIYFERFVILITSLHRDYLTENINTNIRKENIELALGIGMISLQGVIIAVLALGIFEIIKRKQLV